MVKVNGKQYSVLSDNDSTVCVYLDFFPSEKDYGKQIENKTYYY